MSLSLSTAHFFPLVRRLGPWLAGLWTVGTLAAQTLSPAIDPVCRLPRVTLREGVAGEVYQLKATDNLGAPGVWETLMQLAPGTHEHVWYDPDGPQYRNRFYRVERLSQPPLLPVEDFALNDHLGVRHQLFRDGTARAFVLVFTDNAHLAAAGSLLKPLADKFAPQGIRFWLVNPTDSRASLAAAASQSGVTAPVLHDPAQLVARTYGATTVLEAVAIDPLFLNVFYQGPVTDQCETPGGTVGQPYLWQALDQFAAQQPVVVQTVRPRGDSLGINRLSEPSYARDIAPLLQAKCVTCHRPGDIGSWAMTNHAIVTDYSANIRQDVLTGRMPPWHADPGSGQFANDFSLTPAEAAQLVAWLDAGAKRGDGADPLATQNPPPVAAWPLGQPDLILSIPSQSIPATGAVNYRYLLVNNPLSTNVWLRAATVRPGNRAVVHHSLVFVAATVADFLQVQGGLGGFFAGYVPGMDPVEYPAGTGKQLKKGNFLVFQMHYTTSGKAVTDRTQIGLYFSQTPPAHELTTTAAYDTGFTILPGEPDREVVAETTLTRDSVLFEMSPHMHYRGHRMRFEAIDADGRAETLLNVPGYDFAWQALYRLAQPKTLPAGTRIRVTGGFDNSPWNPANPDPAQTVTFGEQTTDEMLIGYLNLTTK